MSEGVERNVGSPEAAAAETPVGLTRDLDALTDDIIDALKTVYDPEIPVNIFELGLIYKVDVKDHGAVEIEMTLTAPGCPVAGEMPGWVEKAVGEVEGVSEVKVNLVFDPPWDQSKISDEAKLELGLL
jgi:FeS assembly SUF system protein